MIEESRLTSSSITTMTYQVSSAISPQAYFQSAVALPREQLVAMQHIIGNALAFQNRSVVSKNPPPPYNSNSEPLFRPRMDMFESSSPSSTQSRPMVTAVFELPGLRKEDVHIEVIEGNMIITGDRNSLKTIQTAEDDEAMKVETAVTKGEDSEDSHGQSSYSVREIKRGRFRRVIALPPSVQLSDIKASMSDGILTVTFPGKPKPLRQSVPVV